jgi:carboxypeptidase C (cathepsin A)
MRFPLIAALLIASAPALAADPAPDKKAEAPTVDQMPGFGRPGRVQLALFPGGHMFYSRPESGAAFRQTARALYR